MMQGQQHSRLNMAFLQPMKGRDPQGVLLEAMFERATTPLARAISNALSERQKASRVQEAWRRLYGE